MATTTPNYGWPVPTSTDFVKDGATAIEALGDAIDATVFALPGGLTLINTTSFSAVSSQSLNNVFTSSYANYRVIINLVGNGNTISGRLRASATDSSAATYNTRRSTLSASYSTSGSTTETSFFLLVGRATNTSFAVIDFINPQASLQTAAIVNSYEPQNREIGVSAVTFTDTTSFDGFSILPDTSTITGTVKVYGYAN